MHISLIIMISIPAFIILLYIGLLIYRFFLKISTQIKSPNGISSLEKVTLGDIEQWIFIRGTDKNNPLLLFLHGGPGEPALGMSSSRKFDVELIEHFTLVHWDQRGAGKSYSKNIPINLMTLDRFVEDCNELIDYLLKKFMMQKVYLVAHSSGTTIGIRMAHKYPEKIHAYIGVAHVINEYEQEKISYEFALEQATKFNNRKIRSKLIAIGPPPYETPEKLFEMLNCAGRYIGMTYKNSFGNMIGIWLNYLTSPEYSLREGISTMMGKGLHFTMNAMWDEYKNINFQDEIRSLKVPVFFFSGFHDKITPVVLVKSYFNKLNAEKGKKFVLFKNSGHFLMIEEKERYLTVLVNTILN
jgi:pimeloyl-ACP methyl ester carboxylesterase